MWNERFLFVISALFAVAISIVIGVRRDAIRRRKSQAVARNLSYVVIASGSLILGAHFVYYWSQAGWKISWLFFPGVGSILAIVLGGVVGSFSARFIWSLFGARFGERDPLKGALILLLLVVVYSLPIYRRELSALTSHLGLSSIKVPYVELSFTQTSPLRSGTFSSSNPTGTEVSSVIPHPSNPRPGLEGLWSAVSDDKWGLLAKDDRYIAFFKGEDVPKLGAQLQDPILYSTSKFLRPARILAGCLRGYVDIFPDSQLLLVDIKPVIQWLFLMHGHLVPALSSQRVESDAPQWDFDTFRLKIADVRKNIFKALGMEDALENDDRIREWLRTVKTLTGATEGGTRVDEFVSTCGQNSAAALEVHERSALKLDEKIESLNYLQPYVAIALANLLAAHGSPDEAVDVLSQWLELWRCARNKGPKGVRETSCPFDPVEKAAALPEWLGIRAEFELSVLLYRMAGEQNITYQNFLKNHAKHFVDFAEEPGDYGQQAVTNSNSKATYPSVTIQGELTKCLSKDRAAVAVSVKGDSTEPNIRAAILRSLLQNEETLLRSEAHFLASADSVDLENLYYRGQDLQKFSTECIYPEGGSAERLWEGQVESYKITAGIVALAVAQRLMISAGSADQKNRAEEIQKQGTQQLREGYRLLRVKRNEDRETIAASTLPDRVFRVSPWEEACTLAERALVQLDTAEE